MFSAAMLTARGNALLDAVEIDKALTAFRMALAVKPGDGGTLADLGLARQLSGRPDLAVTCYLRSLAVEGGNAFVHANLGTAYQDLEQLEAAADRFTRAIALAPGNPALFYNLGNVLAKQGGFAAAIHPYGAALALAPADARAWLGLAGARHGMGDGAGALAAVGHCLTLTPRHLPARLQRLVFVLPVVPADAAEADRAAASFDGFLDHLDRDDMLAPGASAALGAALPFHLAYRRGDHRQRLSRFGDLAAAASAAPQPLPRQPRPRLRLAIVSRHVRRHSVWDVVLGGLLRHLDRSRIELVLLHTGSHGGAVTDEARALVDRYHGDNLQFAHCLDILRQERPDALFYPEIGMDPTVFRLAAMRLAPMQMAGWGHPITSGLPTMDAFLSGDLLESPAADAHYRERLLRLPGTGVVTIGGDTAVGPSVDAGDAAVNFLLCQTAYKFDPADDDLYARIAAGAGSCRVWLVVDTQTGILNRRLMDRLAAAFRRHGVDPADRLRTLSWQSGTAFPGLLDRMDVYLDCPAFSGYTTALQGVRRGIPIVTLEGEYLRQRLAAGLLRQIGRGDTIAANADDYVAIACGLAVECRDTGLRRQRRQAIQGSAILADNRIDVARAFEEFILS